MPPIAETGSVVEVTPSDEIQIIFGPQNYKVVSDQSPFAMRVEGLLKDEEKVVGVYEPVLSGHERYRGLTATLLLRLDNSDWTWQMETVMASNYTQRPWKFAANPQDGRTEFIESPKAGAYGDFVLQKSRQFAGKFRE